MTIEKFNSLSLKEKGTWIGKQLRGQQCGVANSLIFRDKLVFFVCALNGECVRADAEPIPQERPDAFKIILTGRHCLNIILDGAPEINERITKAILSTRKN